MAAPILGMLAGMAGRAALGTIGRGLLASGSRTVGVSRLRRMAGRRMRRRRARGMRMHQAYGRYGTSFKRFRAASRRASSARSSQSQPGQAFYQNPNQQPGQGFSNAGTGQGDPEQAKQQISQFANALARTTMALGAFTGGIGLAVTAVKALHGFASVLVDSQRGTARYSGTMSLAAAHLDVGRIGREIQTGQNTGNSFGKLTQSLDKLERAMQPFRETFLNAMNGVGAKLIDAVTPLVENAARFMPTAEQLNEGITRLSNIVESWWKGLPLNFVEFKNKLLAEAKEKAKVDAGLQNLNDLMGLRVNIAAANGVNRPNPRIPAQPLKGPAMPPAAQPAPPPIFNPPPGRNRNNP